MDTKISNTNCDTINIINTSEYEKSILQQNSYNNSVASGNFNIEKPA